MSSPARHPPIRRLTQALACISSLLMIALWYRAGFWYPHLPERIPIHFDFAGNPDRWIEKSPVGWFMLPVIALGLTGFLTLISALLGLMARHSPDLINTPHKELFLQLSPDARAAAMAPVRIYLLWTTAIVASLFLWAVEGTGRVATGAQSRLPAWPVFVFVSLILAGLVPLITSSGRTIQTLHNHEPDTDVPPNP